MEKNGNVVNELKVEYRRSGLSVSAGINFNMYVDGVDKDTSDSIFGAYLFDYVNNIHMDFTASY